MRDKMIPTNALIFCAPNGRAYYTMCYCVIVSESVRRAKLVHSWEKKRAPTSRCT